MRNYVTPSELARLAGISRQRISALVAQGRIATSARTLDDHPLISFADAQRFVAGRCDGHAQDRPCAKCEIH